MHQAQLDAARAEAEALRDERDSLRASVSSAQEVMESMWCSMETLRKDKTRADENIAATRAEATRAAVAHCTPCSSVCVCACSIALPTLT